MHRFLCLALALSVAVVAANANDVSVAGKAVAFDIDGVLKQGGKACIEAQVAIRKVLKSKLPYVFLTNGGGGESEEKYTSHLVEMLNSPKAEPCFSGTVVTEEMKNLEPVAIDSEHMLLAYSPWNRTIPALKDKPVLIIGAAVAVEVARSYGLTKAIHIAEYIRRHPGMDPFAVKTMAEEPFCPNLFGPGCNWDYVKKTCVFPTAEEQAGPLEDIQAVMVFGDPNHFGSALQIATDLMLSNRPDVREFNPDVQIPMYFAATDLLWKANFPASRLGLGALLVALRAILQARMEAYGVPAEQIKARLYNPDTWIEYGKPSWRTFEFAQKKLTDFSQRANEDELVLAPAQPAEFLPAAGGASPVRSFYMVGDNPNTDMEGARNADKETRKRGSSAGWKGVLVRTGVYQEGDDTHGAAFIANSVNEAVDWILADKV